jgi:hypothetical protein
LLWIAKEAGIKIINWTSSTVVKSKQLAQSKGEWQQPEACHPSLWHHEPTQKPKQAEQHDPGKSEHLSTEHGYRLIVTLSLGTKHNQQQQVVQIGCRKQKKGSTAEA